MLNVFVPLTSRFNTTKWKRPLSSEIRSQIRHKKTLLRNYVRDKNSTSWLQYTKRKNKVKRIVRNDLKGDMQRFFTKLMKK